ncbi:MAG: metalloregulator ArsR/SmtB family transcription factor [Candidatus Binatus sp.]|uniref:ArsR/SmtB family transcription factor n=1 Tax=Candidatus Binatus sp. TaxID=2811406 RepID=UPI002724F6FA|nr:metalloregulator ArsR/SmtB family transcription factor [Candidatus Binatus sp.]MDO8432821.1 metalloregulator ArsR/SmtB family transcription factor [Candidatus Binatus sp.]
MNSTTFKESSATMPPEALEMVAARFRALGEPIRLRILQTLERGELSVTRLTAAIGSTQPNVSRHLRVLQECGLVKRRHEGSTANYSIADQMVFELCELVCSGIRARLAGQAGALNMTTPLSRRARALRQTAGPRTAIGSVSSPAQPKKRAARELPVFHGRTM